MGRTIASDESLCQELPDAADVNTIEETAEIRKARFVMNPLHIAIVLILFASFQVVSYTCFRLAEFKGFSLDSFLPLLGDKYFWTGVLASGGVLLMTFSLVRLSESFFVLIMALYINSILLSFIMLPIAWKYIFDEPIFSSGARVVAFVVGLISAGGLMYATYLWNRG